MPVQLIFTPGHKSTTKVLSLQSRAYIMRSIGEPFNHHDVAMSDWIDQKEGTREGEPRVKKPNQHEFSTSHQQYFKSKENFTDCTPSYTLSCIF